MIIEDSCHHDLSGPSSNSAVGTAPSFTPPKKLPPPTFSTISMEEKSVSRYAAKHSLPSDISSRYGRLRLNLSSYKFKISIAQSRSKTSILIMNDRIDRSAPLPSGISQSLALYLFSNEKTTNINLHVHGLGNYCSDLEGIKHPPVHAHLSR